MNKIIVTTRNIINIIITTITRGISISIAITIAVILIASITVFIASLIILSGAVLVVLIFVTMAKINIRFLMQIFAKSMIFGAILIMGGLFNRFAHSAGPGFMCRVIDVTFGESLSGLFIIITCG